jgi:2-polyprenyl-3-methyl-5-hydroxy-6-metoxy-1,4-benzoquinol methylase
MGNLSLLITHHPSLVAHHSRFTFTDFFVSDPKIDVSQPWPAEGLERVDRCPACGSAGRALLHEGLRDRVFFCAPGEWTLYRCQDCGSAYLDPRPTPDTIGLAYRTYFTHTWDRREPMARLGWFRRSQRVLANGYRNWRFGTDERPASRLGVLIAKLLPSQRALIDGEGRHLPRPAPGARLLDIGCGNGSFLEFARGAGWQVVGIEPDPKAVEAARSRKLDVRQGSVEVFSAEQEQFDGITLGHVVEHVHDPGTVLRACHRLLKPRGWIWLETPNFDAQGYRRYGANWRGLEAPRHLVLFNSVSIRQLLAAAGFENIKDQPYRPLCAPIFVASEAIARGEHPWRTNSLSPEGRSAARNAERSARHDPSVREFITVRAWKTSPGSPRRPEV